MEVNLLNNSAKSVVYAIDAWSANQKKKTGVEMYAFQLIQAMKKHALAENERVVLYSPTKLEGALAELPNGWEEKIVAWPTKSSWFPVGWMQARMSFELFQHPPSVLFVPSQGLPRQFPGVSYPILTTVHDLGFLRAPNLYDSASRKRLSKLTKRSVKNASHLITVSEFSKSEIVSLYSQSLPPAKGGVGGGSRISTTYLAADTSIYKRLSREEIEPVLQRHRIGKHFFLYVGRLDQKKNVETLIRAFDQFKLDRGVGDPYELVLVGEPGFGFASMKNWIDHSTAKDQIHTLGYLEDADVAALMNAATAFVFPSWYEGFGIPNVEAMSSGTPLLVSDIPVHREILGDAAMFVTPSEPEPWVHAMKQLAEDALLREQLITKGSIRSNLFDWNKTAMQTWEVLRSLI
ncbi:MAG: glycosyltransferase family 1 protein [Candidatus Uhrbacteria bacterium]|nr:glycosyltransferase family 1 protein [Candidatus Uhrbacteria bacterium]